MNEEQLARFQKDINGAVEKGGGIDNIVEIVNTYQKEIGKDIQLEFSIAEVFVNINGERTNTITAGRCWKVPCPPYAGCWVSC